MSNFVVSARKYRPTSFEDVVGQDHVAKTLKNALQTDHVAQAFLFTGPRGVGKTTCARILAKVINCQNPINKVKACNECSSCLAFNENASFNIFELDAASNNSVENIRALIEQVRFQPQNGKFKIFIIDEVHMLSTQAFNAFLKTLEEPPSYVIFILATTEKHKIIPTILSRCQVYDFKRIQIKDAVFQLKKIVENEGLSADNEALHAIATKADGAMRDALTIFDKVASSIENKHITYKDVVSNLNLLDYEHYFTVADAAVREDIATVLLTLHEVVKLGFDPEQFVQGLADHFRDLLIAKDPATQSILESSDELKSRYINQSKLIKTSVLLSGINILNQCDIDLVRAKNKRLQVEIALGKITFLNRAVKQDIFNPPVESQEKKTLDVTNVPQFESQTEQKSGEKSENIVETKIEEKTAEIKSTIESKSPTTSFKKFVDLQAIKQSIVVDEATKAAARKNISLDAVLDIWNDFAENNPSKSVQTALKLAKITYSNHTIQGTVPTQFTKDMIMQETILIDRLRDELGVSDLQFDLTIDKTMFPEFEEAKPISVMNQKEKYQVMLEKNSKLGILTQKLGLKLDTEM